MGITVTYATNTNGALTTTSTQMDSAAVQRFKRDILTSPTEVIHVEDRRPSVVDDTVIYVEDSDYNWTPLSEMGIGDL